MKPIHLLNAMNEIDDDLIDQAEIPQHGRTSFSKSQKILLIAAILSLLLCGTASAIGFIWFRPDVRQDDDSFSLTWKQGYVLLPDQAVQTILAARPVAEQSLSHLDFSSIQEWKDFFALPFMASEKLTVNGKILSMVSSEEIDGNIQLGTLVTNLNVDRCDEETGQRLWRGNTHIFAPLSEKASQEFSWNRQLNNHTEMEIIREYTTPSEIPCLICRSTTEDSVKLFLYYGFESVMYELSVISGPAEEAMILEDLLKIADTLRALP